MLQKTKTELVPLRGVLVASTKHNLGRTKVAYYN